MTVAMAKSEGLNLPGPGLHGFVDRVRSDLAERCISVLLPQPVQRLESRRREGIAGAIEPLVEVVAPRRRGMRSNLLEDQRNSSRVSVLRGVSS
jgi:hypothetical protein